MRSEQILYRLVTQPVLRERGGERGWVQIQLVKYKDWVMSQYKNFLMNAYTFFEIQSKFNLLD